MQRHDSLRDDVAHLIRSSREELHWSRSKLAGQLAITEGAVEKWEKARALPNSEAWMFLSILFDWPHPIVNPCTDHRPSSTR
jgi:ribosome-binding protein aMBF1 (putative translation factor)